MFIPLRATLPDDGIQRSVTEYPVLNFNMGAYPAGRGACFNGLRYRNARGCTNMGVCVGMGVSGGVASEAGATP
jgi:hypothetical protein